MAVPGRRNGIMGDEDDDAALIEFFDRDGDADIPLHLRPLAAASRSGDLEALRSSLDDLGGSIDEPVDGDTALHLTCLYGHLSCVQLLLERGANIEAKDEDGAIPLHDACAGGYTEIVQLLINRANGPEVVNRMLESVDTEDDTPLHHAARGGHTDVIRLLLSAGASPTKTNIYGKTPTDVADPGTEAKNALEAAVRC